MNNELNNYQDPLKVYFHDLDDETLNDIIDYCESNNIVFRYRCVDISDHTLYHDTLNVLEFEKEDDIIFFKLKFK